MSTSPAEHAERLLARIQSGPICNDWHWLGYNFTAGSRGFFLVGAPTVLALAIVDDVMPGYADEQVRRLEAMGGRERDQHDYRRILSWYGELLVALQFAKRAWPGDVAFAMEPTAPGSRMNPEFTVALDGVGVLGVEVKVPDLGAHAAKRASHPWQLNARTLLPATGLSGDVTLPRDNPLKDFLVHADQKFAGFRASDRGFRSVLIVVWDDHVQEPVTALLSEESGLFTTNSFHRIDDSAVTYPNVDAVLLIRHQHQFVRGLAGEPVVDGRGHLLDYGQPGSFPPHALVANPVGKPIPSAFLDALHAVPIEDLAGAAEYNPGALVMWVDTDHPAGDSESSG